MGQIGIREALPTVGIIFFVGREIFHFEHKNNKHCINVVELLSYEVVYQC